MNNELENSINYIRDKAGNESGFSIPTNYLNGIEEDFLLKLKEEELPASIPFDVPDTYFNNLEDEITSKITVPKKGKVISLKRKLFKFIPASIAASLLLFSSVYFFNNQSNKDINFEDLSYNDIEAWFEETTTYTNNEFAFSFEESIDDELAFSTISIDNDVIEEYFNTIDQDDLLNEIQ